MIRPEYMASKPEEVGIDSERLEAVFARAQRAVEEGLMPSTQVAVARRGKVAGMRTFGTVGEGSSAVPASNEALYCVMSCTKAFVAAGVWLLMEKGLLKTEERVADIIPEFGTNGKEKITVEQVMLHTAGFPNSVLPVEDWADRSKLLEAFSKWKLEWKPDSQFEYHATSAHWVLSEIIYRRGGADYRAFVRENILAPMGLDELFLGVPEEYDDRVAGVVFVGEIQEPPGGFGTVTPDAILSFSKPRAWRVCFPAGGAVTGAGEVALFYQPLINGGQTLDGKQVLKQETIDFATRVWTKDRHRDQIFKIPVNRGLSIIVAGSDGNSFMRGFGKLTSPRTFGHGGAGGQIAWGDPESGISFGFLTNGFGDLVRTFILSVEISNLAASCAV